MTQRVAGVYVIFGPDRRVYVGQSGDLFAYHGRQTVMFARLMGLDWTIVRYLPGSTIRERHRMESQVAGRYRRSGYRVVSLDHEEVTRRAHAVDVVARSLANRRSWDAPGRRSAQAARMRVRNREWSPQQRHMWTLRSWESRKRRSGQGELEL